MSGGRFEIDIAHRQGAFQLEVSASLPVQGVSALFGASGSGKTSLLRLLCGLDRPTKGRIVLGDSVLVDTAARRWVPPQQRRMGVVFQEPRLFPHYRVAGNLRYAMTRESRGRWDELVALLGIEPLLKRWPATLSGGEARRVAIARALLSSPQLLLLDEPFSGLDEDRHGELVRYLQRIMNEWQLPMVIISHSPQDVVALADHLVVLKSGSKVLEGALETLFAESQLSEITPFASLSILSGRVAAPATDCQPAQVILDDNQRMPVRGSHAPVGTRVRLMMERRELRLMDGKASHTLMAEVEDIFPALGEGGHPEAGLMNVTIRLAGQRLSLCATADYIRQLGLAPGSRCRVDPGVPAVVRVG